MAQKDLWSRLTDASEEAITRLADAPGADRLLGVATSMRDRMDELQKKVRGMEAMEKRIDDLEREVKRLSGTGGSGSGSKSSGTRKKSTTGSKRKTSGSKKKTG